MKIFLQDLNIFIQENTLIQSQISIQQPVMSAVNNEFEKVEHPDGLKKFLKMGRREWSSDEDTLLKKAIHKFGSDWKQISGMIMERNPSQCAQRWKRIKPETLRKRRGWTQEEDIQLLQLVKEHENSWSKIAKIMYWRSGKQIRERYINQLMPKIKLGEWKKEEDELIFKLYQIHGSKWTTISKELTGRPVNSQLVSQENSIKNRFYSHIRQTYMNIQNPYYVLPIVTEENNNTQESKNENESQDFTNIENAQPKIDTGDEKLHILASSFNIKAFSMENNRGNYTDVFNTYTFKEVKSQNVYLEDEPLQSFYCPINSLMRPSKYSQYQDILFDSCSENYKMQQYLMIHQSIKNDSLNFIEHKQAEVQSKLVNFTSILNLGTQISGLPIMFSDHAQDQSDISEFFLNNV